MAHKGPHISISPDYVVNRILRINIDDFAEWPESVRHLAIAIAEELFLVAYNPFINVETVRNSVHARFERESMALAHYFANAIGEGITMFWSAYEAERSFREELIPPCATSCPTSASFPRPPPWWPRPRTPRTCAWNCPCWWWNPTAPSRWLPW